MLFIYYFIHTKIAKLNKLKKLNKQEKLNRKNRLEDKLKQQEYYGEMEELFDPLTKTQYKQ